MERIEIDAGHKRIPRRDNVCHGTHDGRSHGNAQKDGRSRGAAPQPLGRIGIPQQGIGDDEHGKTGVP